MPFNGVTMQLFANRRGVPRDVLQCSPTLRQRLSERLAGYAFNQRHRSCVRISVGDRDHGY
jgi:hypothetical protein